MRASVLAMMSVAGLLSISTPCAKAALAQAQPQVLGPPKEGFVQRMHLTDGTQLVGKIVAVTDSTIQFEGAMGTTTLFRSMVARVKEERPGTMVNGQYYFPNPNTTRLLFAPTGRTLQKGEGYFSDHWVFFPSLNFGISNNFSMGGGLSLVPGISPLDQFWYVTPKLGVVQGPTFNFSIGALAGRVPSENDGSTAGLLYGVTTFGGPDASFTTGLSYGFVDGEVARRPTVMLGGEARLSARASFVSENYLFSGGFNILSGGMRFFGTGASFDFAAMAFNDGGDGFCCVPYLGVFFKF